VTSGLATAYWLLGVLGTGVARLRYGRFILAAIAAVLGVGLDFLLEPVAYHIKGYWQWHTEPSQGYYGVPWSNFAAWLVSALVMNGLVSWATGGGKGLRWRWLPVWLYGMNVFMFGVVNVMHGFWVPGAIMVVLLGVLGFGFIRRGVKMGQSPTNLSHT
jgi:putative membrane protein